MKFERDVLPYLEGEKFSNGLKIKVGHPEKKITNRIELLEEFAKNKTVLHIGFADHLPLILKKIANNTWLHKRLIDVADVCIGLDIDREVVDFVKQDIKIANVYCLDVINQELPQEIADKRFDYIILGEVLEHVDNPVGFLSAFKQKFSGKAKNLIVTVPNAWDLVNMMSLRDNQEFINTDHRFWFTPYTLAKVGLKAGLSVNEFFTVQNYPVGIRWKKWLLKRYPLLRETVVMVFDI